MSGLSHFPDMASRPTLRGSMVNSEEAIYGCIGKLISTSKEAITASADFV
jgi:hypothetical protein